MAFVNEKLSDGKWITIDRERNVFLNKMAGPNIEGRYDCELIFEDQIIKFTGYGLEKIYGHPKLGENRLYDMSWHIMELFIPDNLKEKRTEIIQNIKESLQAWGWNFRGEKAHSVTIKILGRVI